MPAFNDDVLGRVSKVVEGEDGELHVEIAWDTQGTYGMRLIPDRIAEQIYAATIRPLSIGYQHRPTPRQWKEREQVAIYHNQPWRRIPRQIRQAVWNVRYRLAARLYPDNFYDRDD